MIVVSLLLLLNFIIFMSTYVVSLQWWYARILIYFDDLPLLRHIVQHPIGPETPGNLEEVAQAILIVWRIEGCAEVFRPGYVARIGDARRGESRCIGSLQWKEYALRWSAANPAAAAILNLAAMPRCARVIRDVTRREMMTVLPGDVQCILVKLDLTARIRSVHVGVNTRAHTCTWLRTCGSISVNKDESASAKLAQFASDADVAESCALDVGAIAMIGSEFGNTLLLVEILFERIVSYKNVSGS